MVRRRSERAEPVLPNHPRAPRRVPLRRRSAADGPRTRGAVGATIHMVTVAISDFESDRIRAEAAQALGTDPDDPRIHVEVDTDVAGGGPPLRLRPRRLPDLPVDSWTRTGAGNLHRLDRAGHHRTLPSACRRRRSLVVHPDPDDETAIRRSASTTSSHASTARPTRSADSTSPPHGAHALGMKLTIVTVAEPCPAAGAHRRAMATPPRTQRGRRRVHPPSRRTVGAAAPGLDTAVVYDPIGAAAGTEGLPRRAPGRARRGHQPSP